MPNVSLNELVKMKLKEFMKKEGCKTFSDAVNLLLEISRHRSTKSEDLD